MKSTKELAWELGLLRKRSSSTSATKRLLKTNQVFSYLIVIDFESTCWKDQKYKTQEIIEFPAVLMDTRTGEFMDEFHHYVQPQEDPILSEFCKHLTGITQDQVDQGIPLNLTLSRFNQWLKRIATKYNIIFYSSDTTTANRCTFVTWSDWDLSVCLQYESRRKQLRKPAELNSWIDLRAVYRKFYSRKPQGLNGALKDVGINFEGREHSGICDAQNTAKLAFRMMQDGCVMMITKTLGAGAMGVATSVPPKQTMKRTLSAPVCNSDPTNSITCTVAKKPKLQTDTLQAEATVPPISAPVKSCSESICREKISDTACGNTFKLPVKYSGENLPDHSIPDVTVPGKAVSDINNKGPSLDTIVPENKTKIAPIKTTIFNDDLMENDADLDALLLTLSPAIGKKSKCVAVKTKDTDCNQVFMDMDDDLDELLLSLSPGIGRTKAVADVFSDCKPTGKVGIDLLRQSTRSESKEVQKSNLSRRSISQCIRLITGKGKTPKKAATEKLTKQIDEAISTNCVGKKLGQCLMDRQMKRVSTDRTTDTVKKTVCVAQKSQPKCDKSPPVSLSYSKTSHSGFKTPAPPSSGSMKGSSGWSEGRCPQFRIPKDSPVICVPSKASKMPSSVGSKTETTSIKKYLKDITNTKTPNQIAVKGAGFKTPVNNTNQSGISFKTPVNVVNNSSNMKRTPPMCECGRRANRKMVQNPGPNHGRFFFACPSGRKGPGKKSGCGFFKWEEGPKSLNSNSVSKISPSFVSNSSSILGNSRNSSSSNSNVSNNSVTDSSICLNQMSYTSMQRCPMPQPNFNTPSATENSGSFLGSCQKKTLGMIAGGRANTILKPPMF